MIRKNHDWANAELDGTLRMWDGPTMKLTADSKRRVVLPRPAEGGDVFEVLETGDRIVMLRLQRPTTVRPPISPSPLDPQDFNGIDIDAPSFAQLSHEGLD